MANQRDKSKKLVTMWLTEPEKKLLKEQAAKHGYSSVTDFVKAVAAGVVKVSPHIKAIALAAIGSGQSGCGPLNSAFTTDSPDCNSGESK